MNNNSNKPSKPSPSPPKAPPALKPVGPSLIASQPPSDAGTFPFNPIPATPSKVTPPKSPVANAPAESKPVDTKTPQNAPATPKKTPPPKQIQSKPGKKAATQTMVPDYYRNVIGKPKATVAELDEAKIFIQGIELVKSMHENFKKGSPSALKAQLDRDYTRIKEYTSNAKQYLGVVVRKVEELKLNMDSLEYYNDQEINLEHLEELENFKPPGSKTVFKSEVTVEGSKALTKQDIVKVRTYLEHRYAQQEKIRHDMSKIALQLARKREIVKQNRDEFKRISIANKSDAKK